MNKEEVTRDKNIQLVLSLLFRKGEIMENILKVIVTGNDIGEFLVFYFNDECFKGYNNKQWELLFYQGGEVIPDIPEFRETASKFGCLCRIEKKQKCPRFEGHG